MHLFTNFDCLADSDKWYKTDSTNTLITFTFDIVSIFDANTFVLLLVVEFFFSVILLLFSKRSEYCLYFFYAFVALIS